MTPPDLPPSGRSSPGAPRATTAGEPDEVRCEPCAAVTTAVAAYAVAVVLLTGVLGVKTRTHGFFDFTDIGLYHQYAIAMDAGLRPFVSFPAEYPSAALRLFDLPGHPADLAGFKLWFAGLMLLAMGVAAVLVTLAAHQLWRRRSSLAGIAFAAGVLAAGTIVANRYDAAVALCIALLLWSLSRRLWIVAGLAIGLGAALKLTPIVLLPLPLILATAWPERTRVLSSFAVAAIAPFLLDPGAAWRGIATVFRYHGERPLQIESVLATPLLLARISGVANVSYGTSAGAQTIIGPGAGMLAAASGFLALAALVAVVALALRARPRMTEERWIVLVATALMLAVVVPSKVLSPQYVVWLIPVAALVAPASRLAAALLFGALLLTGLEFPAMYWAFLRFELSAVLVVVARNLALAVAFGWVITLLASRRATAAVSHEAMLSRPTPAA